MASELDPRLVAARLEILRSLYVAETVEEARVRLQEERPRSTESFSQRAARNLEELRALYELARHLERARRP